MFDKIFSGIGSLLDPIRKGLDDMTLSAEERRQFEDMLDKREMEMRMRALELEEAALETRRDVVMAEAQGESWLQRSWRPVTMLVFVALIVAHWLGLTTDQLTPEVQEYLYSIIKLGLTGYIVGRSAEKVGPELVRQFKQNTNNSVHQEN